MTVYCCLYGLVFGIWFLMKFLNVEEKKARKIIAVSSFILIVLIFGLRHPSMGVDLGYGKGTGYLASFDTISNMSWSEVFKLKDFLNYEKGYIIYNKIIGSIWQNEQFFLFITAFLSIIPIYIVIYKKSVEIFLSTVIYIGLPTFLFLFSGLRQILAIGICFLSILFIEKKQTVRFILLVLLASTFHSSALIFLMAYPLYHIPLRASDRWLSILAIPIVYIFRVPLFEIFSKVFKENAEMEDTGAITLLFVFTAIYMFCIFFADYEDKQQNGYLNLFIVSCCIQTFGTVYQTAIRVGYYFMLFLTLLLPLIIGKMKNRRDAQLISMIVTIAFVAYGIYAIYSSTWAKAYPYYFFWENV